MPCDYSEYPANWKTWIVPRIRERSGDKCEWCGVPNNRWVLRLPQAGRPWADGFTIVLTGQQLAKKVRRYGFKPVKIILTTAHLDHDKANNDGMDAGGPARPVESANLVHLCQKCHLNHDRPRHMRSRRDNLDKRRGQMRLLAEGD